MIHLIKKRVQTVKALTQIMAFNRYTFDVDTKLSKPQIKALFQKLYEVPIIKINTHNRPLKVKSKLRKPTYGPSYKRVLIQFSPDMQTLPYGPFQGMTQVRILKELKKLRRERKVLSQRLTKLQSDKQKLQPEQEQEQNKK